MQPSNASGPDARPPKNDAATPLLPPVHLHGHRGTERAPYRPHRVGIAAVALSLFCNLTAQAQNEAAARLFQSGNDAFQAEHYAAALEAFEAAVAAGQSGPAVHFNIGVTAFRLGMYSRAETAFNEVARTPAMAALAHYNLGLVALRRRNSDAAKRWFATAEREAGNERLRELATTRLTELQTTSSVRDWAGYAAFAAGYDDNVALISNSDVLGISDAEDSFTELQLALSAPLAHRWRLDAGLAWVNYQELDSFDQTSVHGGGHYRWDIGDWMNDIGLQLAYTTLDGERFESKRTLALQTTSDLRPNVHLRARYRFHDIDGLNAFSGLSGHRHEAGARLGWVTEPWNASVEYQIEVGDYDDPALSATRHELSFDLEHPLSGGWAVVFEAMQRHSRYDLDSNGAEHRTEFALAVMKTLSSRWRLVIRHAYTDNDADLAAFDYRGNRLSAGVEAMM